MKVMILAAGRGNRMRPLTDSTPKPLLKIDQFSLIEHLLFRLSQEGFRDVIINLAHLGEKIQATLQDGKKYGVNICYSEEGANGGLETGGGIFKALPLLGKDHFLVISGDIWTNYCFSNLKQKIFSSLAHLILVNNPPYHLEGDFNLVGEKLTNTQGKRLTFGNIGVYHPDLFLHCQPGFFPLGPLLRQAVIEGKATGEHFQGTWINVGTPQELTELRLLANEN